jgi:hypothetical protein
MEDIVIEDIVHCLSNICRYCGHSNQFYSVAEHSLLMAQEFPEHAAIALFHDAAEVYFGDIPRPIKNMLPNYKQHEHYLLSMIFEKYAVMNLDQVVLNTIEEMDIFMLWHEKYSEKVMFNPDRPNIDWGIVPIIPPEHNIIKGYSSEEAKELYKEAVLSVINFKF